MKKSIIIFALFFGLISCQQEEVFLPSVSVPVNENFTIQETQEGTIQYNEQNITLSYDSTYFTCIPDHEFLGIPDPNLTCITAYYADLYFSVKTNSETNQFMLRDYGFFTKDTHIPDSVSMSISGKNHWLILKELVYGDKINDRKRVYEKTAHLLITEADD